MATDFSTQLKSLSARLSAPSSELLLQEDLNTLKSITAVLLTSADSLDSARLDLTWKAMSGFVGTLVAVRKWELEETEGLIADIISDLLLMLPRAKDQPKYLEILKLCIDWEKGFYKASQQEATGFSVPPDSILDCDLRWWKKTIAVNDLVDAVKLDSASGRKCWARGKVVALDSLDDSVYVAYEDEGSVYNRSLPRYGPELAPAGTMTKDSSWRKDLREGSLVDAFDSENLWYNSTVLDRRSVATDNDCLKVEVLVAFRVYEHDGIKLDENGHYRGWSSKYDEWISAQSPRLARYGQMARHWPIPKIATSEEAFVDDTNDILETRLWAYCMPRDNKSRSKYLVRNINRFATAGHFDTILRLIREECSFEAYFGLIDFCGRLSPFYHRSFCLDFIPKLIETAMEYLLNASDSQIRGFSKEKITVICGHFEALYKRLYTIQGKNEKMEQFHLAYALKCFQSQYLERRIQGLRTILDVLKTCKSPQMRTILPEALAKWILGNRLLEGIFGPQGHVQLVQRSGEILQLLLQEDALNPKHLQLIWSVAERNDEDSKLAVYHVLSDNACFLLSSHMDYLVDRIASIPASLFSKEDVDLIHSFTKYPLRAGAVLTKASELLWKTLKETAVAGAVADLALEKFCDVLKGWDMRGSRISTMARAVESIKEGKAAVQCLKIIRKILPSFPLNVSTSEVLTKDDVQEKLLTDFHLMDVFFSNFHSVKSKADRLISPSFSESDISSLIVCDRTAYRDQIEERLGFLRTFYEGSRLKLKQDYVSSLWTMCCEQSLCSTEKTAFLVWLADLTDLQNREICPLEDSGAVAFFRTKVAICALGTANAFFVFRNYFLISNVQLGLMQHIPSPAYFPPPGFFSYNSTYSAVPDPPLVKDFEYRVLVPPEQLEGMAALRKLILTFSPAEEAMEFLSQVYDHLAEELQGQVCAIRKEFLAFCKGEIVQESHKVQGIALLKRFLEESEKGGTGGLKSHSALLKGEMYAITLINNASYHYYNTNMPQKLELRVSSSTTLYDLRCLAGKSLKIYWDQVRLTRPYTHKEIRDCENGKTLSDLRLKPQDSLIVTRKQLNIPRADLLLLDGNLSPEAQAVFSIWFYAFADKEGKMSPEQLVSFTNSCTGDHCKADDTRIKDCFCRFDEDRDGYLSLADFLEFYRDAAIHRTPTVWTNLYSHHYRHDFKSYLDIGKDQIHAESLPRALLANDPEAFALLFEALSDPRVVDEAWDLLIRLPTNQTLLSRLRTMEGEWTEVLDAEEVHKLLYALQIVEALVEEGGSVQWKLEFLQKGGFRHVYGLIKKLDARDDMFHKNCLLHILDLVSFYVLAAFKALEPEVYEAVEFVRRGSEIPEALEEPEAEAPKRKQSAEAETSPIYGPQPPVESAPPTTEVVSVTAGDNLAEQRLTQTQSFLELVEGLKLSDFADSIIANIDFPDILDKLTQLISDTLAQAELENEDRHIVEAALSLLVSCVLHNNQLLQIFYSFCGKTQGFVLQGLTIGKSLAVRKAFGSALQQICLHAVYPERPPLVYFLRELVGNLPSKVESKDDFTQYFELLVSLVSEDLQQPSQDYSQLSSHLMHCIDSHPCQETHQLYSPDKVLLGLLLVLERICASLPELKTEAGESGFVERLWEACLFPQKRDYSGVEYDPETVGGWSGALPPKCKLRDSRAAAYKLLVTLVTQHPGNMSLLVSRGLQPLLPRLDKLTSWSYSPSSETRSAYGYSGITNLGYICYMNSILQQFYMIPQFRYAILEADDHKPPTNLAYLRGDPEVDRTKKGVDVDENVLHQLQSLFGFLDLSDRQAVSPSAFCYAFKDFDGNPTNTSIQQDAQEFLNMAFERIEQGLKGTKQELLLKGMFEGKACNRFLCQGCGVTMERFEEFMNLSLDVKHSKTLYESLGRLVSGEVISDFYCESCDKKVEMTKKTCLAALPNILILHLQRIVYNFDLYANEKINSRLEFPHLLSLEPYTRDAVLRQEGANPEPCDYDYELVGVVVHSGTAETGHYVSLIRHRLPDGTLDPKKWFEFNDALIRYFE